MLQRQVMFKQLKRKQQLQELGNKRSQNCANQLSGGQCSPTLKEIPVQDSSRMQMPQHGEPNANLSTVPVSSQESDLVRQVPAGSFNSGFLFTNYSQQGFLKKGDGKAASLDPMEQKISCNTDDKGWESAFSRVGKMSSGGFECKLETPSSQSGKWSDLMHSAVAETSSSDAGAQDEWSGLSFQNLEPFPNTEKLQSDWLDRNLQNDLSPSSKSMTSFTNFQQSTLHIKQEEYHPDSSHATMQHSPRYKSHLVDNKSQQLFQGSLPSANLWSAEQKETSNNDASHPNVSSCANDNLPSNNLSGKGHESGGSFWVRGRTSSHVSSVQNKRDKVKILKNDGYSVKTENMAHVGVSTGQSVTAPSEAVVVNSNYQTPAMQPSSKASIHRELPNKQDYGFRMGPTDHPQTLQPCSFSPVYSDVAPQGYSKQKISNSSGSEFPVLGSMSESKPSLTPDMLQHSGVIVGLPTPFPENHNSLRRKHQQPKKGKSAQEGLTEINNSTSLSRDTHHLEAKNDVESDSLLTNQHNQASNKGKGKKVTPFPGRDIEDFRPSLKQTYSPLHKVISTRNDEADSANNQHANTNSPSVLPLNATRENLAVSVPKKRKLAGLDMVPWHKEVNNHEQWKLQDISTAEYLWAEASNGKPEAATNDSGTVEKLHPMALAKRRLVSSTQLMQQIFRPQPAFIMRSDATPNCDCVAYFAARSALGDAWSLTGQSPSETNNMSPNEIKATKACEFTKIAEVFTNRAKKVKSDLSRLDRNLSLVDIKVGARELERVSSINRLFKFHKRIRPPNSDSPSSSISTTLRKPLQKHVMQVLVPETLPEVQNFVSL